MVKHTMIYMTDETIDQWLGEADGYNDGYNMRVELLIYFFGMSAAFKDRILKVLSKWPAMKIITLWKTSKFTNIHVDRVDNTHFHELILPLTPKKFQLGVHADVVNYWKEEKYDI